MIEEVTAADQTEGGQAVVAAAMGKETEAMAAVEGTVVGIGPTTEIGPEATSIEEALRPGGSTTVRPRPGDTIAIVDQTDTMIGQDTTAAIANATTSAGNGALADRPLQRLEDPLLPAVHLHRLRAEIRVRPHARHPALRLFDVEGGVRPIRGRLHRPQHADDGVRPPHPCRRSLHCRHEGGLGRLRAVGPRRCVVGSLRLRLCDEGAPRPRLRNETRRKTLGRGKRPKGIRSARSRRGKRAVGRIRIHVLDVHSMQFWVECRG
jgi:hypothetical protein